MYWGHESDTTVAPVLRQLGAPHIVEAHVPMAWLSVSGCVRSDRKGVRGHQVLLSVAAIALEY
jgi:hypothetical protein